MFEDFATASAFVREHQIRMIDLRYCDLAGRWRRVTLSASEFKPSLMRSGVGFDGSSVGFKSVKSGDMALIPDLSSAFVDPFYEIPTLCFLTHIVEADTKEAFSRDPRSIAQKAAGFLTSSGIADESFWGPEYEFYVFNGLTYENTVNTSSYHLDSVEGIWNAAAPGLGNTVAPHGGYHAISPKDQLYPLRSRMVGLLEDMRVPIKYHHHEVGGPGQCEIETPMMPLLKAADASMQVKYVAHMAAIESGQTATFLPKPLYAEAGSGMHFHQQLIKNGVNQFYDSTNPTLLSQTAMFYRRLVPGYEAPVNCFFSTGNRSAAIRIPKYATEPEKVRFEFRPPDGSCNPYLAMAVMLMAGLDGIINQVDPTRCGFGPINENIFSWTPERRKSIKSLPTSLGEALLALSNDHAFLLAGDVFDEDFLDDWVNFKSEEENQLRSRPHPFEIQQYFDI
jgi:glutamine synthetase